MSSFGCEKTVSLSHPLSHWLDGREKHRRHLRDWAQSEGCRHAEAKMLVMDALKHVACSLFFNRELSQKTNFNIVTPYFSFIHYYQPLPLLGSNLRDASGPSGSVHWFFCESGSPIIMQYPVLSRSKFPFKWYLCRQQMTNAFFWPGISMNEHHLFMGKSPCFICHVFFLSPFVSLSISVFCGVLQALPVEIQGLHWLWPLPEMSTHHCWAGFHGRCHRSRQPGNNNKGGCEATTVTVDLIWSNLGIVLLKLVLDGFVSCFVLIPSWGSTTQLLVWKIFGFRMFSPGFQVWSHFWCRKPSRNGRT